MKGVWTEKNGVADESVVREAIWRPGLLSVTIPVITEDVVVFT